MWAYISSFLSCVEACVAEIKSWMITNKLMLNGDKTVIIVFSAPRHSVSCDVNHINIDGHDIVPAKNVKNLGVIFDDKLSLDSHNKNICKTSLFHLKNISNIRSFLPDKAAVQLTHAFVSSRLDYCNSLLQGLPSCSIGRLQSIQNIAARILTRTREYEHITTILKNLHWLPVASRIDYTILVLTYCAINNISPAFIQQLITPYVPVRKLRSDDMCLLNVPSSRLQRFGGRSFSRAAPIMWNNLPDNIRKASNMGTFKTNLKTHLFQLAFE